MPFLSVAGANGSAGGKDGAREGGREGVAARCITLPRRRFAAPLPARTKQSTDRVSSDSILSDSVSINSELQRFGEERDGVSDQTRGEA